MKNEICFFCCSRGKKKSTDGKVGESPSAVDKKSKQSKTKGLHIGPLNHDHDPNSPPHWKAHNGDWTCVSPTGNCYAYEKKDPKSKVCDHIYKGETIEAHYYDEGWFKHAKGWSQAGTSANPWFLPARTAKARAETKRNVIQEYELGRNLGEGAYGAVKKAKRKCDGGQFAVKIITKSKLDELDLEHLYDEVHVLRRLSHTNCCELIDIFDSDEKLYLVLELLGGGDLYQVIQEHGQHRFSEEEAAKVAVSVSRALMYMHSLDIVHRDLKPANLVYSSKGADKVLKVTDFGLSSEKSAGMQTICGTDTHMAPEILNESREGYGKEVDMWSLGVILYTLLAGIPPFWGRTMNELHEKIRLGKYEFHDYCWANISQNFKDLIAGLLIIKPEKRWTAKKVAEYHWEVSKDPLGHEHMDRLRLTMAKHEFRIVIRSIIAIGRIARQLDKVMKHHKIRPIRKLSKGILGKKSKNAKSKNKKKKK